MFWLVLSTYGSGAMCFTCNWCGFVGVTWSIMMNSVVDYLKYNHIYVHSSNVKVWCILGNHVRLWLCACICSLRVDTWLLLLDYMSIVITLMMIWKCIGWLKDDNGYSKVT